MPIEHFTAEAESLLDEKINEFRLNTVQECYRLASETNFDRRSPEVSRNTVQMALFNRSQGYKKKTGFMRFVNAARVRIHNQ